MKINIDTIDLYFSNISGINLLGWRKDKDMYIKKSKSICYKFYPKIFTLVLQFSLSTLQNEFNYLGYNFKNSHKLIKFINDDIFEVVEQKLDIKNANLSRIDINQDFTFNSGLEANEVLNFFKRLTALRMQIKEIRENSVEFKTKRKNRICLRVYRKDVLNNLPQKLKPTIRVEFQICKRKKIINCFGTINPVKIILNPEITYFAWIQKLNEYKLYKAILNEKWFFNAAITNSCKTKKVWSKYRKIIEKSFNNQELTKEEKAIFQKIMREMYLCGITPSYSNIKFNLIPTYSKNYFKIYIKELVAYIKNSKNENVRNKTRKLYNNYLYIKSKILDSS